MSHISFSELKDWVHCPFYHKLTRVDKIDGFTGNEYTAFGSAIHSVCEKKLLKEDMSDDFFVKELKKNISELDDEHEVNQKLVVDMIGQGKRIIPEIEDSLSDYFEEFEVMAVEMPLFEPIEGEDYNFKGYIDAVIKTPDGKHHLIDWKTCSWGWDMKRKTDKIVSYQLTFYKYFYCKKYNIDPNDVVTYFVLLKRTAKKDNVEFFKVSSGSKKTQNALNLLKKSVHNIMNGIHIKNRLSCSRCEFRNTEFCT